jgi:hypothetical protein
MRYIPSEPCDHINCKDETKGGTCKTDKISDYNKHFASCPNCGFCRNSFERLDIGCHSDCWVSGRRFTNLPIDDKCCRKECSGCPDCRAEASHDIAHKCLMNLIIAPKTMPCNDNVCWDKKTKSCKNQKIWDHEEWFTFCPSCDYCRSRILALDFECKWKCYEKFGPYTKMGLHDKCCQKECAGCQECRAVFGYKPGEEPDYL